MIRSTIKHFSSSWGRLVALSGIAAAFATLALLSQSPKPASAAQAQPQLTLVSSVPTKDSRLTVAPQELRFTFSRDINIKTTAVDLRGADGKPVALDTLRAVGGSPKVAVAKIIGSVARGTYTVSWLASIDARTGGGGTFKFVYTPPARGEQEVDDRN